MRLTRASDPPFVDHSTIPRVDITQMNTRARISKSICAKHSPQRHFPKRHLRCSSSFFVTEQSRSGFIITLFTFCLFNNLATGAAYALHNYRNRGITKVALVDFDVPGFFLFSNNELNCEIITSPNSFTSVILIALL